MQNLFVIRLSLFLVLKMMRHVAHTHVNVHGQLYYRTIWILKSAHECASFFVVVEKLAEWPGYPERELRFFGAIGDHTWNHLYLRGMAHDQLEYQMKHTRDALEDILEQPVRLFRPPYGAHDAAVDAE